MLLERVEACCKSAVTAPNPPALDPPAPHKTEQNDVSADVERRLNPSEAQHDLVRHIHRTKMPSLLEFPSKPRLSIASSK